MADPLSIAASIAGVISLADIVFVRTMKYARAMGGAAKEINDLAKEVNLLGGALHSLSRLARALDDTNLPGSNLDLGRFRMHHIQACSDILSRIDKKLRKAEAKGTIKKFTWPFSVDYVKDLVVELVGHKQSIQLALSADSTKTLLQLLSRSEDMQNQVAEIVTSVQEAREVTIRIRQDSERDKVLKFFLKCNPQKDYETTLSLRHPRTGMWLLQLPQFQTWLSTADSKLWLRGIPGAGKTVLAGSIIETALLLSTEEVATCFFFCDYKSEETHSAVNIVSCILYQLAIQNEEAYAVLESFFKELHPSRGLPRTPDLKDATKKLREMTRLFQRVFLVVDGLDECRGTTDEVVGTLFDVANDSDNLSAALLSRDEFEIRNHLEGDFEGVEIAAHTEDITEFVTAEIEERIRTRRLRVNDISLKGEILQELIEGAQGMFRWVACQLDHLGTCLSDSECRNALKRLPPTLYGTYVRILEKVPRLQIARTRMILHFIAYAQPPLTIEQLREAVSIPQGGISNSINKSDIVHEESIAKLCSSLVRKSNDGESFEFAHASVREFLEHDDQLAPEPFRLSLACYNETLGLQSLKFLQLDNFNQNLRGKIITAALLEEIYAEWTFYEYAVKQLHGIPKNLLADGPLHDTAIMLFSPEKTPAFILWAITFWECRELSIKLPWEDYKDPDAVIHYSERIKVMISDILDEDFTALHMAALLCLASVCTSLITRGLDVNAKSKFGTPLECIFLDRHGYRSDGDFGHREDRYFATEWHMIKTIDCLVQAGASVTHTFLSKSTSSLSLVGLDLITVRWSRSFSITKCLLAHGVRIQQGDLEAFDDLLGCWTHEDNDEDMDTLKSFIEYLSPTIDRSPLHFELCKRAWKGCGSWDLESAIAGPVINSRIFLSVDSLEHNIFAAITQNNLEALHNLLRHDKLQVADVADSEGDTPLHVALKSRAPHVSRSSKRQLAIFQTLIDAGCDMLRTNAQEELPHHVWNWWTDDFADEITSHDEYASTSAVTCLMKAGVTCATQDKRGRNALHIHCDSLRPVKAFLNLSTIEDVVTALATIDDSGHTPISRALAHGNISAMLVLMNKSQELSAVLKNSGLAIQPEANHDMVSLLNQLPEERRHGTQRKECTTQSLYYLAPSITLETIERLKDLPLVAYKNPVCGLLPLDGYLARCLHRGIPPNSDLMDALCPKEMKTDLKEGTHIWTQFVSNITTIAERDFYGTDRQRTVDTASTITEFLVCSGVVECFERYTGKSAIIPLLEPFKIFTATREIRPVSDRMIFTILQHTRSWPSLRSSSIMPILLNASVASRHVHIVELLLANRADVHSRVDGHSALDVACTWGFSPRIRRKLLQLLLKH
ncbi:hypothetical protein GGR57DRAFT_385174 [Xylariaceae sp. FL1272]|nr:hypothetical protein GGR57DRAFT_385174 [Xylariaceae sp. FL1272]